MTDPDSLHIVGSASAACSPIPLSFSRLIHFSWSTKIEKKVLDFGIQISSNGDSVHVAVWHQETGHPVMGQVNAVTSFIDQNGDWSVRRRFWHMFRHFLHNPRIPDHKPQSSWGH
jgi:hypothetical protein